MFLLPTSHCDGSTNTAELQAIGAVGELRDGGQWLQTKEVSLHHWRKTEGASVNTSPLTPPCLLGLTPTVPTSTPKQQGKANKPSYLMEN